MSNKRLFKKQLAVVPPAPFSTEECHKIDLIRDSE